jgi:hypothetical protein
MVTKIPLEMCRLEELKVFQIHSNLLDAPLDSIALKGTAELMDYLKFEADKGTGTLVL